MYFMKALNTIDKFIGTIEKVAVLLMLFAVIIVGTCAMVYRYVFMGGLFWAQEFVQNSVPWLALLGASVATIDKRHIAIDIVPTLLKGKPKQILNVITEILASIICFFLTYSAYSYIKGEYLLEEMLYFLQIPMWIAMIIMPIAFFSMGMRFALQALNDFVSVLGKEEAL